MKQISNLLLALVIVVITLVASIGMARMDYANATAVTDMQSATQVITAMPTSSTNDAVQSVYGYGETEVWINPTTVPTDFAGSFVYEQCNSQSSECIAVTPTVQLGSSGAITYSNRATPVVMGVDTNYGRYARVRIDLTSATTSTLNLTWHLKDSSQ